MSDERDLDDASWDGGAGPDPALEAQLVATLAAHAEGLSITDRPFRPDERSTSPVAGISTAALLDRDGSALDPVPVLDAVDAPSRRARRGPAVWLAGVAAAVVIAVVVVAVGGARESGLSTDGDGAPLVGPDTLWVPASAPDGLELWDVAAGRDQMVPGTPSDVAVQLLESTTGQGALLVGVAPHEPGVVGGPDTLTARGTTISAGPPTQDLGPVAITQLLWSEGDVDISGMARDLDDEATVALLDSLTFADAGDPLAGFAAPPGWTIRTDETAGSGSGASAVFRYGRGEPTGAAVPDVQVATYGAGYNYPGYLLAALVGEVGDDGAAVARLPIGPSDAEPAMTTIAVWPDGHTVMVIGADDEAAERIALGVRPATLDQVRSLAVQASDRLGAAEVIAAADLPDGRVEVVGSGSPSAICLTASGTRTCKPIERRGGSGSGSSVLLGSTVIGSTWYLFAADRGGVGLTAGSSGSFTGTGTAVEGVEGTTEVEGSVGTVDTATTDTTVSIGAGEADGLAVEVGPTTTAPTGAGPGGPAGGTVPPTTPPAPTVIDRGWTLSVLSVPAGTDAATAAFTSFVVSQNRPLI